ncbi:MAG TPA: sigma-54 dependent transcriptional regulator [Candidatus Methylomirabilis sp.]|nr:sigma-54 dependent transcriptional regulator [Candidatus Methylomirabilis sp.]
MATKHSQSESSKQLPPDDVIFGRSAVMAALRKRADKVCQTDLPVLVCGDRGTGKETLAQWIHAHSAYRGGPFVKVNCAALPSNLLESELFGYQKGAFTGAAYSKPGRVELAANGTLFLDEITDLDIGLQSKILHFLQDGRFSRLGDETERVVQTRLICSTGKELQGEIDAGRFRADLFYRISVVQLRLPLLRERCEDIPLLAEYLRAAYEKQFDKKAERFGREILNYWQNQIWPGNLRELANGVARYVLIGPEAAESLALPLQRPKTATKAGALPLKQIADEAVREMEKNVILDALRENRWNRRRTAESLKISYRALIYKIRHAGIVSRNLRSESSAHDGERASGSERALPAD